ncbi:MAG: hypothetical protein CV089_01285 [Nitrospira sp. WS110]|nr:hypothetical protein [Nitrospira sp. WS110]
MEEKSSFSRESSQQTNFDKRIEDFYRHPTLPRRSLFPNCPDIHMEEIFSDECASRRLLRFGIQRLKEQSCVSVIQTPQAVASIELEWPLREVREFLDNGNREVDVGVMVGTV